MALLSTSELTGFCRRVGTSLRSGVDVRRVFEREGLLGSATYRTAMLAIVERIKQGDTLAASMSDTGVFPPVALAMTEIGEHTGKLDEALLRLAEHYEHQTTLQRQFLLGIAWPAIELTIAILVIGLIIYIFGAIAASTGTKAIDVTGLGLSGGRGVLIYFLAVGTVFAGIATAIVAIAKGWLGPRAVQWAMNTPLIGPALRHTAMSRLTWSLGMSLDSGMDARRAVELSLLATQNPFYLSRSAEVVGAIAGNREFHEAYRDAKGFPGEFLLELETAEIAGTLSESLVRMSRDYNDRAKTALRILTGVATLGIWAGVFTIIIALIVRLAMFYIGSIYEALEMTKPGNF